MNEQNNYPRVTHIISQILLPPDYFAGRDTRLGEYVHLSIDYLERGVLDEASLDEQIKSYVEQYKIWKKREGFIPLLTEFELSDTVLKLAGRVDLIGRINGQRFLIDIKTGSEDDWHILQLSAYYMMYHEKETKVGNLYLKPFGHKFIIYSPDKLMRAWDLFKSALNVYHYRATKGRTISDGKLTEEID